MKKLLSVILVLAMMLTAAAGLTGCNKDTADSGKLTVWGGINGGSTLANIDEITAEYHALWEAYNPDVEIEWIDGDIKMLLASGDFPAVMMSGNGHFQNQEVAKYAAQGVFVAIEDYISEKDTPNIWAMFNEHPEAKAAATSPDGHIYALPMFRGDLTSYFETFFYINKTWLDKLGLEVPTTLDEFYNVLKAFKTQDPNGNGKADEIPMLFGNEMAFNYPETLLSAWGISTKFGVFDAWLNVKDGEVRFCPLMDEWKEMCKFYNKLWNEGLLDIESFTQEAAQYNSKVTSATPVVGFTFNKDNPFINNGDEYIAIAPFSADGKITPVVHIHPGSIGQKNAAIVTSACADPQAALKFLDGFYNKENTITNWYGGVGEDKTFTKEGDMYVWNEPAEGKTEVDLYTNNTIWGTSMIGYLDGETEYDVLLEKAPFMKTYDEYFEVMKPYIDKETWPRPYYLEEDATRVNELLTDLSTYVEQMKAGFITGKNNIDAEWDSYIAQLKKLGAEEFLEINQRAYDVYQKAFNEMAK